MKYIRNQFVRASSIMWWGFIFITGGVTLWWGITVLQWSWAGIFTITFGVAILSSLIVAMANRSKLRRVVLHEFQTRPEASIEDVSITTGISRRDVQAIILDLKSSGQFFGKFSTKTGQIKHVSIQKEPVRSEDRDKYCDNCGTYIGKESAQYCPYCGAKT
ncbi:MAG: zinc ribbon domain-containing protein [Candidatus Hodarchaeota archaeon]